MKTNRIKQNNLKISVDYDIETRSWQFKIRHATGMAKYTGYFSPRDAIHAIDRWLNNFDEKEA